MNPTNPLRKAAVLLSALDAETVDQLLERLSPQEAALLRQGLMELERVDPREQAAVMEQFVHRWQQPEPKPPPGQSEGAVSLELSGSPAREDSQPRRPEAPLQSAATPSGSPAASQRGPGSAAGEPSGPLATLAQVDPRQLAGALQQERPQTIALVLAHLPPEHAAEVLSHFSGRLQADVLRRMARLEQIDPDVLQAVEQGLCHRLQAAPGIQQQTPLTGSELVARVLQAAPRKTEHELVENFRRYHPQLARQFHTRSLQFEQLAFLPVEQGRTLAAEAGLELLGLALLDASPGLAERFLSYLSPEERNRLQQSWQDPGPLQLEDIRRAKEQVVQLALELEAQGRLSLRQLPSLQAA